jgi:hypothetical protein
MSSETSPTDLPPVTSVSRRVDVTAIKLGPFYV